MILYPLRRAATIFPLLLIAAMGLTAGGGDTYAAPAVSAITDGLVPHRAVYEIQLVATQSGAQIVNIHGDMTYEWKPACDAWVTTHGFDLSYEYVESPGMHIRSDFSTYENMDGTSFHFTSRRARDGKLYQELRGHARMGAEGGEAVFSKPENLKYTLAPDMLFPMRHTIGLLEHAQRGEAFYLARVFDGSDEEGPIQINAFITPQERPDEAEKTAAQNKAPGKASSKIAADLLDGPAWNIRMAVFQDEAMEEESDYEMSLVFHKNGVISNMLIEYDNFSVKQKLVALEEIPAVSCARAE